MMKNKETMKNIVIGLLSVILVTHSIEKKNLIDDLNAEIKFLNLKVSLADSLVESTTLHGIAIAAKVVRYRKKINNYENNTHKVVVTMYHPVSGQTDDTPNITADGSVIKIKKASEYNYVAVSRNMLKLYGGFLEYGNYVWVDAGKKSGVYQVRDTMAPRWINRIDILESPGVVPYRYDNASLRKIVYNDSELY